MSKLYSIIINDDVTVDANFRLHEDNIIKLSASVGLTGLALKDPKNFKTIMAVHGQVDKRFS